LDASRKMFPKYLLLKYLIFVILKCHFLYPRFQSVRGGGLTSGSTGRMTCVSSGRTVMYWGAGLTVVMLGRVVCRTAGGGKGITACNSGS